MDLDIVFAVPGLPFDGTTLDTKSLGGSETAGLCLARELGALGHHVTVFSNGEPGSYDGVTYFPMEQFQRYAATAPHDVTVVQRLPELLAMRTCSRLNVLWCHDLALVRTSGTFKAALWNVDRVAVVSRFMADQYREVYGLPEDLLWVTRNGIETARLAGLEGVARDRKKLFYAARPERGLDVMLGGILPKLLREEPDLKLFVAAYDNSVDHLNDFYAQVNQLMLAHGDRVEFLGALPKRALYEHLASAGVYCYPTPSPSQPLFAEVSSILAMEAQALGLPIVTSRRGALLETIAPEAGVLVDGDPTSEAYVEAFSAAVMRYVRDDVAWRAASAAGRLRAASLDWRGVAQEWSESLQAGIQERNESPSRLARQFIRRSDIMAAREILNRAALIAADPADLGKKSGARPADPELRELSDRIERDWGFTAQADGMREQYERIGETHRDVYASTIQEPRFAYLEQWLVEHPEVHRILDFGCAQGGYAVGLSNKVGREWVGVDIDKHSVAWAEQTRSTKAEHPEALTFRVGDDTVDLSDQKPFDCLIVFEVLEHVADPTALLQNLERWVKPDGHILLTVPYGPWEWMSYETYPHRAHLWEYDLHDLRDLFGKKRSLRVHVMPAAICEDLAEPLGWHVIEYRVDGSPTGRIDMDRKIWLQRPRQTVSALLIAGPDAEETLHWCLRSVRTVVDEIVIGDTGMSAEGRRIAAQYGARVVPASDPKTAGFETPRNEALAACRMDFVLWLDTDEKALDAYKVNKYLRQNLFDGYSVRQHHFAVDTTFTADLPVRLFRRRPRPDGKALRWFGMIHEHPEYDLNTGPGTVIVLADVHIAHVGYLIESGRRGRFERNWPLLQKDAEVYPGRVLQKHFLCRDLMLMVTWELAKNGGQITPQVRERCEAVKTLFRTHFLGKGTFLNTDTLQYYSSALQVLGEGVEVAFAFGAAPSGAQPGPLVRARFASYDEAQAELGLRMRDAVNPYVSPWW